jgi:CheY-like chemotaxis protein
VVQSLETGVPDPHPARFYSPIIFLRYTCGNSIDVLPMSTTTSRGDTVILYVTATVALIGAAVLTGWHLRVRVLVQIVPGAVLMQDNTALCFLALSASAEPRAPSPEASLLPRGTETIMLAEDEAMVRALTFENLRECGYEVLEAANGEEALSICRQYEGSIDLLLTDVVMPLISGRELAERMRKTCSGIRMRYMSGYTDDAIVHHGALEAGTAFLEKTFTLDALARKVREVLDGGDEDETGNHVS